MAVQISTNVEFIQANTTTNAGFILLPSTTTPAGRLLTIKDTAGTFGLRPLTYCKNDMPYFTLSKKVKYGHGFHQHICRTCSAQYNN
jgi:hypothetical protein